ncbi:MAG TPA: anthranilate synthase component I [Lacipirellulaceae bacterium]|jgi:anthranilate synthase component 1
MSHFPDFATFSKLAGAANYVPVYRRVLSDVLTPVSAFHKIDDGGSACLFESVIGGEKVGRYSFLAAEPFLLIEAYGKQVSVTTIKDGAKSESTVDNPLDVLRDHAQAVQVAKLPELPPFTGGAVGYAGYDTVRYIEHLPNAPSDDRGLADLSFAFYDHMIVFDNVQKTAIVVALARVSSEQGGGSREKELRAAYEDACRRVDRLVEKLAAPGGELRPADIVTGGEVTLKYSSNLTQAQYEAAVRKCAEYIRAGDIFQVVIGQRLAVPLAVDPFEVYRTLRVVNPSPFMFFLRTPKCTLVGSSPEIMVRVVDGKVTVRPLAGTRPRGKTDEEDQRLAEELLADPKERAEHVMLVDLGRNDVGRVANYGSVEISDVMVIERYSHVMHITSNVTGQLTDDRDAFDALAACLPAGTVSGAPKVRAMEIIDEVEPHRRGPYAGAVGYIDFAGNMDTCIALRTIVIQDGTAFVQVGAGIVADSVPEREYEETMNKARGLLKAIEITEGRCRS